MAGWLRRDSSDDTFQISMDAPVDSLRYVVLDTELTSLEHRNNRLLSIGAITMKGPSIQLSQQFYRVVNPQCAIPPEGIVIHKLRPEDLKNAGQTSETLADFAEFVSSAVLVGHFVDIDLKILRKEMIQTGHTLTNPAIDTARVHQWILRHGGLSEDLPLKLEKLDLPALAEFYRVEHQDAHHALADAFQTARVWQTMLHKLQAGGIGNLKKLLKIGGV